MNIRNRVQNAYLISEDELAKMLDTRQMPGVFTTSIALFLNATQWLKGEVGDKEYLEQLKALCEHAELAEDEDVDKLRTFADRLLVMQFYGGKAKLFATKGKQEAYRRMFSRAYYDCFCYLQTWFDEEMEEESERMPYSEYLWEDFQLCTVSNARSRIAFWKMMLESYKILKGYNYLPVKPLINGTLSVHSKEAFLFRNRGVAYSFQLVLGLTVLCGCYFICSIGKVLYSLLVLLPYNRLLLYSGAKVYGDSINEYLTLKNQLGNLLFANRECLIGMAIGIIFLLLMDIAYNRYKESRRLYC